MAERSRPNLPRRLVWALLAAILLLGLGLRLYGLDAQSIWYDEGWSIHVARQPLGTALDQLASPGHTHPPGYYLLLMAWVRLFGHGVVAVRLLSALLGVATLWMIYRLAGILYDDAIGLLAALLLALAPAHVVYSQEVRMYALLGLAVGGLVTLHWHVYESGDPQGRGHYVALALCEIVALYTHYFGLFVVLSLTIWRFARDAVVRSRHRGDEERRKAALRRSLSWLTVQGITLLSFLPWLGVAWQRALGHTTERAAALGPLAYLRQGWAFLMGGHIALYGRLTGYALLTGGALAALVILSLGALGKERDRPTAYLLAQIALPVIAIYGLMRLRPGFHPRYLLMLLPLVSALVAHLALLMARRVAMGQPPTSGRGALGLISAGLVVALWLVPGARAAWAQKTDSYYQRDDARATAAHLEERLPLDGLVLIDVEDWALRYYLDATDLDDRYLDLTALPDDAPQQIAASLEGHDQAALVSWHQGQTDECGLLRYLLTRHGVRVTTDYLPGYTIRHYRLEEQPPEETAGDTAVDLGPFRLSRAAVESEVPCDEALAVALEWKLGESVAQDYKVALTLVDPGGREVARSDDRLLDKEGQGTARWAAGRSSTSYHVLELPLGLSALPMDLQVGLYSEGDPEGLDVLDEVGAPAGKRYTLATVELLPPRGVTQKELDAKGLGLTSLDEAMPLAPGLALESYRVDAAEIDSGQTLGVLLQWRALEDDLPGYEPALLLVSGDDLLAQARQAPVYDLYPTDAWQAGQVVLDWRDLVIPAMTPDGEATLRVSVDGDSHLDLGSIRVRAVERVFQPPAMDHAAGTQLGSFAELAGYDLGARQMHSGQPIALTLYWRGLGTTEGNYTVFTHLLAEDGHLLAQHDGPPAGGERPTQGWIPDEYVVDPHELTWVDGQERYSGPAQLEVGLYDAASGQRLTTPDGQSRILLASLLEVQP